MSVIINRRGKNVKPEEHKLVVKYAKQCIRQLNKVEYELPNIARRRLLVITKARGQRSYGGYGEITIDVTRYRKGCTTGYEYKSYAKDPVIGSIVNQSPDNCLLLTVAHEISHYVQHTYVGEMKDFMRSAMQKPHGKGFKTLYGWLRRDLVNPRLT